jgi:predicted RNase H-like HicB family nuclease
MEYTILRHQAEEGGFWSEVPALPGCYSQGETVDETLHNTKEAIESYLIAFKEDQVAAPIEETCSLERSGWKLRACDEKARFT